MRVNELMDKLHAVLCRIERTAIRRDYWRLVAQMPDCTEGVRRLAESKAQRWQGKHLQAKIEEAKLMYEIKNGG